VGVRQEEDVGVFGLLWGHGRDSRQGLANSQTTPRQQRSLEQVTTALQRARLKVNCASRQSPKRDQIRSTSEQNVLVRTGETSR
jgi:hypothetical protein